ncbi:MAG: hypothetical protein ABSA26_04115 [Thermoguttaceae bacterium]|jgi:hypothetical protein
MFYNAQQSVGPAIDGMQISDLVDVIRQNLNSGLARMAINSIYEIIHAEFPEYRYQHNFSFGDLESQLLKGIRENSPIVAAFIENESKSHNLWKWRIHFVEIAGVGAVISDMLSSITSPDIGTRRAHSSLKEPLYLEPFGRGSRLWSCLSKPWEGSSVSLAFFGHTNDHRRRLVSVRTPTQYPDSCSASR